MAIGAHEESLIGVNLATAALVQNGGSGLYAMAALDAGCCFRFTAQSTNDIKSFRLWWASVTAPGVVRSRIETVDATTGKPTGTLYDANATIDIVPAAGNQTYTFATLPTTGLTVGAEYCLVLLTTTAGTTQTLYHMTAASTLVPNYPTITLTTVTAPTRSSFAEIANGIPVCSLVDENDGEISECFVPFSGDGGTINTFFGANTWAAAKFTTNASIKTNGISMIMRRNGTPAGDARIRIFDNLNNLITGTTMTVDKDSLTGISSRRLRSRFATITLPANTYRIVFDSASSADTNNAFGIYSHTFMHANCVNNWRLSTSANGGSTWTDSTTAQPMGWLCLDDFVAGAGGGSPPYMMRA